MRRWGGHVGSVNFPLKCYWKRKHQLCFSKSTQLKKMIFYGISGGFCKLENRGARTKECTIRGMRLGEWQTLEVMPFAVQIRVVPDVWRHWLPKCRGQVCDVISGQKLEEKKLSPTVISYVWNSKRVPKFVWTKLFFFLVLCFSPSRSISSTAFGQWVILPFYLFNVLP